MMWSLRSLKALKVGLSVKAFKGNIVCFIFPFCFQPQFFGCFAHGLVVLGVLLMVFPGTFVSVSSAQGPRAEEIDVP